MRRNPTHSLPATLAVSALLAAVVVVGLATAKAWPHHVPGNEAITYPLYCCNSAATSPMGDCAPIDDQYVKEEPDGYHIDLPKGAHPKLLTKGYKAVIPYSDAKKQPIDNRYHICLSNDGGYRFCFFPKPGAV